MWRSLMRTTPAGRETWKPARAPDADDELGRAAADVDHDGRLARAGRRPDIAPRNVSCASSSPLRTLRVEAELVAHPLGELGAVGGVAHRGGEDGHVGAAQSWLVDRLRGTRAAR